VPARVDVKTAQALLGHADPRLTIGLYAQVVPELGAAAAEAMGARFLEPPRDGRAMEAAESGEGETDTADDGAVTSEDDERPR